MNVQGYITTQPEPHRQIMTILRSWVLDLGPHTQEKISYKIPFFNFYGPICYLSPNKEGVDLSFTRGRELDDESKLLDARGRKEVKSITFFSVAETEEHEDEIRRLLNEAAILNEYHARQKQKKKKKQ
jgi:hypothetical protein